MKRRNFLQLGLGTLAVTGAARAAELCLPTPAQTEGPFYPAKDQVDKDWDLTQVQGRRHAAEGEFLWITGQVLDQHCQAVEGALVEIWQACSSGKYNHPRDPNPTELDPHFQYWGRALTDAQGNYIFKTIKPGSYPAAPGWIRPPHIHYKVTKLGYHELTTQLYFADDALNDTDRILQSLPKAAQEQVIRPIQSTIIDGTPADQVIFPLQIVKA